MLIIVIIVILIIIVLGNDGAELLLLGTVTLLLGYGAFAIHPTTEAVRAALSLSLSLSLAGLQV